MMWKYVLLLVFLALVSCGGGGGGLAQVFTLTIQILGHGQVASDPAGVQCSTGNQGTCAHDFAQGTNVTLTATPDPGWQFDGWSGDADCADGQVTLTADVTCTATFSPATITWARTYGGTELQLARAIAVTSDGGFVVAGYTSSFGARWEDFWVLKLDAQGNVEWEKTYGAQNTEEAFAIQQTVDGGYIVAGYSESFSPQGNPSVWILKLDAQGNVVWQKTYYASQSVGGAERAYAIQQTSDGGYIVAGHTNAVGRGSDMWILKLDAGGNVEWEKAYGGPGAEAAYSVQQTSDGGYIVAGTTDSFGAGREDVWVLKLDAQGNVVWQKTYGGPDFDKAQSIQQTSDGGYIVAGGTYSFGAGGEDFWVLKLDTSGNVEWQKTYGGPNSENANAIQQTADGGYIVAGETVSFGNGPADFWVLKLDAAGNVEWQRTYGGTLYDSAYSIRQTPDGGYIVAGRARSFGVGRQDLWILKLDAQGNVWACDPQGLSAPSNATVSETAVIPLDTNASVSSANPTVQNTNALVTDSATQIQDQCG